jgi:hypothetical protein
MYWALFLITVTIHGDNLQRIGTFDTMFECFGAWDKVSGVLTDYGDKPKIDNQVICVQVSKK